MRALQTPPSAWIWNKPRLGHSASVGRLFLFGCWAWVFGIVCQLQQARLFSTSQYLAGLLLAMLGLIGLLCWRQWLKRSKPKAAAKAPTQTPDQAAVEHTSQAAVLCKQMRMALTPLGLPALVLICIALLAFSITGWRAAVFVHSLSDFAWAGSTQRVVATVVSLPEREDWGLRFVARIQSPAGLPERVLVSWYDPQIPWGQRDNKGKAQAKKKPNSSANSTAQTNKARLSKQDTHSPQGLPPVHSGQTWEWTLRLRDVHGYANPFGFDYALWMWQQGIGATASVRNQAPPVLLQDSVWNIDRVRQFVRDRIFAHVSDPKAAGLLSALAVGDQSALDTQSWSLFRATGVSHLVSVSGLHITLFASLAAMLLAGLWRLAAKRRWRICLTCPLQHLALGGGLLLAFAYALLSGFALPAQRTILMLALFVTLRYLGLQWPWYAVWSLALAMLLGFDPWGFYQAGFWLSFVAVGVLFAVGKRQPMSQQPQAQKQGLPPSSATSLQTINLGRLAWFKHCLALAQTSTCSWLIRGGIVLLREQLAITLALSPLVFFFFHQVSVVGVLANLLAVPWVTLLLIPLSLLGLLFAPLWSLGAVLARALQSSLEFLAAFSWAQWFLPALPAPYAVPFTLLGVLGGIIALLPIPWAMRCLGLGLTLPLLLWRPAPLPVGSFSVLAADIGQGSAVLIQTANHSLLFDAGPAYRNSDAGERLLLPLLRALGVRLNSLVLSHADGDHIGGAKSIQKAFPAAQVLGSTSALRSCTRGHSWVWDGVVFSILHPAPEVWNSLAPDASKPKNSNALSCVLKVRSSKNNRSALLTGDIGIAQETQLVAHYQDQLAADVLLVAHHGSKTSSSPLFLAKVKPTFALAQAGYRNPFGHPHPKVVQRYADFGIPLFVSDRCGAWFWLSSQPLQSRCERTRKPHYWQITPPPRQPP